LPPASWQIVPGISSVQYLFSRIGLDMNDLYVTSSHGKQPDFDFLFSMPKVAMVTDQLIGPRQIADALQARGLSRTLYIGENLSYPDERIHCLRPADVASQYAMNVVVILDEGQ
jgi:cobalt-precorrin-7 (C5)-methyltransferase